MIRSTFHRRTRVLILAAAVVAVVPQWAGDDPAAPAEDLRAMILGGRFVEAEAAALARLEALDASGGADSPEAAEVLDVLAEARWRGGKSAEPATREYAERALAIKERLRGPDHAEVAESLNNVAVIAFFNGDYDGARTGWERALAIRERALGPDDVAVAQSLNNLANLLWTIGDYAGARPLHERALAIREKALGPGDRYVAQSLNNLGSLLRETGDFVAARAAYERALAIRREALGPGHPQVGSSMDALAVLLWHMGDRERAREMFEGALAVFEGALGGQHPHVASSLNNFGLVLLQSGEYAEAVRRFESALAIWEAALGAERPEVAHTLTNLGRAHLALGDLASASPLLERAAAIRETALGGNHPDLAESLDQLARLEFRAGDAAKARERFERAVAVRRRSLGERHPSVAESLGGLASLHLAAGDAAAAVGAALESESIARDHLRLTGRSLSEREALRYATVRNRGLDLALSVAAREAGGDQAGRVLDALIRSRAVVLDEMAARKRTVAAAADPRIAELAAALARSRARLANLTVRGLGELEPDAYRALLERSRDEKEADERALAEASAAFARERERSRVGLDEVAASLPRGSALVSFVVHDRADPGPAGADGRIAPPSSRPAYTALVLRAGAGPVRAVALGDAGEIEGAVSRWKREAAHGAQEVRSTEAESEQAYREAGLALRRLLWDPLSPHLAEASLVFLVPDGAVNLVSFASLPSGEGAYLVEDGPSLHYLSAERDLVAGSEAAEGRGLLALGGPDYDADPAGRAAASGAAAPAGTATRSACGSFDTLRFRPLPAAEREAAEVAELWKSRAGPAEPEAVVHLSGAEASESAFKAHAGRKRVLHVATHGFFLGGDCAPASTRGRGFTVVAESEPEPVPDVGLSPLLVSGLALAGANERKSAASGEDNGILTAEEIASLDLSGVEWAVLSACDTGVGEIAAGEGVFGLRRAMQVAGVRTLIMSLWPVDDEATRHWMKTLYAARLTEGLRTVQAVRTAGLQVLRERREAGKSTHPFYWAAFVAAGDWR